MFPIDRNSKIQLLSTCRSAKHHSAPPGRGTHLAATQTQPSHTSTIAATALPSCLYSNGVLRCFEYDCSNSVALVGPTPVMQLLCVAVTIVNAKADIRWHPAASTAQTC